MPANEEDATGYRIPPLPLEDDGFVPEPDGTSYGPGAIAPLLLEDDGIAPLPLEDDGFTGTDAPPPGVSVETGLR
jgi:hypothetical protein